MERNKNAAITGYPSLWQQMISEWQRPDDNDRAWLLYSANYLFRTAGIRWALDPLTLKQRLPEAPLVDLAHDLDGLSFILLTHRHADHLDLDLLRALADLPIMWVIPEFLLTSVAEIGLPKARIIFPKPMEPFELEGIRITPFDGLHWEVDPTYPDGQRGVPTISYLVEFSSKRWLFPGDTRTYDVSRLPDFGPVDGAFVHLWLGRASALLENPPLLGSFGRFCKALQSPHIIVTHLHEFGRDVNEYWDDSHYQQVERWLSQNAPDIVVESAIMGERVNL